MAGEDLKLSVIISAFLDAKGFEEAQTALRGLASQTKEAGAKAETASDSQKKLGREFGGTRGPVADLTRVMLQNIGVTGAAGESAKTAGLAMNALAGSASLVTVGAAGVVAGLAFLVPKIVEWARSTKDIDKIQGDLHDSLNGLLPDLEDYIQHVAKASAELRALADAAIAQAFRDQKKAIGDNDKAIADATAALAKLKQGMVESSIVVDNARSGASHYRDTTIEERAAVTALEQTIADLTVKQRALLAAQEDGQILGKQIASATRTATKAEEAAGREADERARAVKADAAFRHQFSIQQNIDAIKDMAQSGQSTRVTLAQIKEVEAAKAKARVNRRLQHKEEMTLTAIEAAAKRAAYVGIADAGLQFLGAIFGKNKEAAMAQVIVDTAVSAVAAAKNPPGLPYTAPFVALAIAQGAAQLATIKSQNLGFDDPMNDIIASQLGRKSAKDFVNLFGGGFHDELMNLHGGPSAVYNQTTINRGSTVNITANGVIGTRTGFRKWLEREMTMAERQRARTSI